MDKATELYTKYKALFQASNLQRPSHEEWLEVLQQLGIVLRQRKQILSIFAEAHDEYWMENSVYEDVWLKADQETKTLIEDTIWT